MVKRLSVIGAAIVIAALMVGVAMPAADSSTQANKHNEFRVTATVAEISQIDLGATGPSLGDEIVFSGPLMQGQHQVGHQGAVCTTVSQQRHEAQCIVTYSFADGQITGQALVILGSPTPYAGAITGGTGEYDGAEGTVSVRPATATNPNGTLTFELGH